MSIFWKWRKLDKSRIKINYYLANIIDKCIHPLTILINTPRIKTHGRTIAAAYDTLAVACAWIFAHWILIETITNLSTDYAATVMHYKWLILVFWKQLLLELLLIMPLQLLLFKLYGLYRGFWRFASIHDLQKILYVSVLGGMMAWLVLRAHLPTFLVVTFNIAMPPYFNLLPPDVTAFLYLFFLAALLSSARLCLRFIKDYKRLYQDCQRVIIIGAGNAGESLARDLLRDESHRYKPVAFVDDDLKKHGREIHNVRVVNTIAELPKLIKKHAVDLVLIAIPSASSARMRSVIEVCEKANVRCYTLPGITDLANGRVSINVLRHVSLVDLLGRYPVTYQWTAMKSYLKDKTILITGGGGSIGSELCRQIMSLGSVARLVVIDNHEYNLYAIEMELLQKFPACQFYPILLSVTDRIGIQQILQQYRPHMVFHAAAYKHVPLLENHLRVAIANNIIGTKIIAEESANIGVDIFVLISSDKAVNPTNIMGATKRAAEYFCQNLNDHTEKTRFITVRFGNVLDSTGSVIPLFRKQIENGGPITVTHPDISRFFMTIPEASQLILQAVFLSRQGGGIFVLDMGEPIKIKYLAEQMIKLAGKIVNQDIKIIYTGLRPGEKLYEECFYANEELQPTMHAKILQAQSFKRNFNEIKEICQQFEKLCQSTTVSNEKLIVLLQQMVPEYKVTLEWQQPNLHTATA